MSGDPFVDLEKEIVELLDEWLNRDVDGDRCLYCNSKLNVGYAADGRFCDMTCREEYNTVFEAYSNIESLTRRKSP